jgi:hypothetical protein
VGVLDLLTGRAHRIMSSAVSLPVNPYTPAPQWPQFVVDDLFGDDAKNFPMTREEALRIPAVSKARNLLISKIAELPLRAIQANADGTDTDVTTKYTWLYRTNSTVSPYERMAWTVDDLIFYGVSLWLLDRGTPDGSGRRGILNASWCPTSTWCIKPDEDGQLAVHVDGVPIAEDRYCLINSPFEGLLTVGVRTLRGARDVEKSWTGRALNPIPLIVLHQTDDSMDPDEVKAFVDSFAQARVDPNGAIGYIPPNIDIEVYGTDAADLSVEGRNAVRTDVGSHLNVRASVLDGTQGVASLTYATTQGERNAFYDDDLPFWTGPIQARLSLDDMVPRGVRIRFDKTSEYNQPAATGTPTED